MADIAIANLAVMRLGDPPLTSFTTGSNGPALEAIYDQVVDELTLDFRWSFLRKHAQLVHIPDGAGAPAKLAEYFRYKMPEPYTRIDKVVLREEYLFSQIPDSNATNWRVSNSEILFAGDEAWAIYYTSRLPSTMPKLFKTALVHALMGAYAPLLIRNPDRASAIIRSAKLDLERLVAVDAQTTGEYPLSDDIPENSSFVNP